MMSASEVIDRERIVVLLGSGLCDDVWQEVFQPVEVQYAQG